MVISSKCRDPVPTKGPPLRFLITLQKGQTFLERLLLEIRGLCRKRVVDRWRLSKESRDPRAYCRSRTHDSLCT